MLSEILLLHGNMKNVEQMLVRYDQLLREQLSNPYLTNAEIAEHIGLSERTLYRYVQNAYGISPNHYLRRLRLDRAEELLRSGDYRTIKEVALRVGYRKIPYFTRLFEEDRGVHPQDILREHE